VAGFARTHDQTNALPAPWEPRDGNGLLPGRDPIPNRVGDRLGDPAHDPPKDQHLRHVLRMPGKAVIHLSGNDRNLGSDPADQGVVREWTG
jgi:hypothetical protein